MFYNWARAKNLISRNPAESINYQTAPDNGFELFTDAEIKLLLETPNQRTYTGFRDYVMMIVLLDTGIRAGELTSLTRGDFDLEYRQIVLRAKTTKSRRTRTIPISHTTTKALRELFDFIAIEDDQHEEFVFLTQYGDPFKGDNFAKMLKLYATRAGKSIKARVSPHTFRHYFAVKFLRNGGDPFALMKILGHTDMAMTLKYVKYTNSDISEIHDKASPAESMIQKTEQNKVRRGSVKFR